MTAAAPGGAWEVNWTLADGSPVASGGNASVYRLTRKSDSAAGALKQPRDPLSSDFRVRFLREAHALKTLDVKGVPRLYELGDGDSETPPYIVSEFVEGRTLQTVAGTRPLPTIEAIDWVRQLVDIVDSCHSNHDSAGEPDAILHRDIKPDNILVDEDGRLWLVDFGGAWFEQPVDDLSSRHREGGNRFLRLPEHQIGRPGHDPRSDLTLVVGILFFLVVGFAPRSLTDEQARRPHERYGPDFLADDESGVLQRAFDRGFLIDIDSRFQSASELLDVLAPQSSATDHGADLAAVEAKVDGLLAELSQQQSDALDVSWVAALGTFHAALKTQVQRPGIQVAGMAQTAHWQSKSLTASIQRRGHGSARAQTGIRFSVDNKRVSIVATTRAEPGVISKAVEPTERELWSGAYSDPRGFEQNIPQCTSSVALDLNNTFVAALKVEATQRADHL